MYCLFTHHTNVEVIVISMSVYHEIYMRVGNIVF